MSLNGAQAAALGGSGEQVGEAAGWGLLLACLVGYQGRVMRAKHSIL